MMTKLIAWTEKVCRTVAVVGMSIALAMGLAIGYFAPAASAKPATPEAAEYEVEGGDYSVQIRNERSNAPVGSPDLTRDIQSNLREAAETVRNKLNLDQPLYSGTKEVIDDVRQGDVRQGVNDAVENTKDVLTDAP
jgi:hypothetical protein